MTISRPCLAALMLSLLAMKSPAQTPNPALAPATAAPVTAAPAPTRQPPIISPEIHADGSVTFRLRAPEATKVEVWGDWVPATPPAARDENGVWTATVGPLSPDIYGYSFHIDGRSIADPANTWSKPARTIDTSGLEIPGAAPVPYDRQSSIARGEIHLHDYDSQALGKVRHLRIYTPAEYLTQPRKRFPVLYLLHGSGDNEATWTEFGRAHIILDNLIAAGKATPMIVVMTDGHASSSRAPEARAGNASDFERDLLGDVMPLVESRYRTRADRDHRAIAGLSMGGNQSLLIGLNHRDLFSYVGGMSSAIREPIAPLAPFWADPVSRKAPLHLLWIAVGKDDFLLPENRAFNAILSAKNVPHQYLETEGGHRWWVWRRYLGTLAPQLFKASQ